MNKWFKTSKQRSYLLLFLGLSLTVLLFLSDGEPTELQRMLRRKGSSKQNSTLIGSSGKPIMHTFFELVPGGCGGVTQQDHLDLLQMWEEAWQNAGWETRILTIADAERNKDLKKFNKVTKDIFIDGYNLRCFYRWFAMAVSGGGWMTDYDTFPLNMNAKDGLTLPNNGRFTDHEIAVPCLVSGSASEWRRMSNLIVETIPTHDGPMNDMRILDSIRRTIPDSGIYLSPKQGAYQGYVYDDDGSVKCSVLKDVKAMHFSHQSVEYAIDSDRFPIDFVRGYWQAFQYRGQAGNKFIEDYRRQCKGSRVATID